MLACNDARGGNLWQSADAVRHRMPGTHDAMDPEQQERFREAVDRKSEEAEAKSKTGPQNPRTGDVDPQTQAPTLYDTAYEQDDFDPRDKNSGHGKKTADKWNQ